MFRIVGLIVGIAVAAVGGVIAYRALFLEPSGTVVVTGSEIRELPNTTRLLWGLLMLVAGTALAFYAARRKPL